jgi:hypothetical protein
MKKVFVSLALAAGMLLAASEPAMAIRPRGGGGFGGGFGGGSPQRPRPPQMAPAFPSLHDLDDATCAALAKAMMAPEAAKHIKALQKKGGELRSIKCLPRRNSDEQSIEFTFRSVGSPFNPNPPAPWTATFKVQMFLPQDAGWQVGEVTAPQASR